MRPLFTGGACLLLSACTVLGPDYQAPRVEEMASWHSASEGQQASATADYRQWWNRLNDPVLSALVEEALDERLVGVAEAAGVHGAGWSHTARAMTSFMISEVPAKMR